jgi:hypothetical protein
MCALHAVIVLLSLSGLSACIERMLDRGINHDGAYLDSDNFVMKLDT